MNLSFSMVGAYLEGITDHPQKVMTDLGIVYQHPTPQSITDSWWFWNCENVPDTLPKYLSVLDVDPDDCIGCGLNEELAEMIKSYKKRSQE